MNNIYPLEILATTLIWLSLVLVFFYFKTRNKEGPPRPRYYKSRSFKLAENQGWYKSLDKYLRESGYFFIPETYIFIHILVLGLIVFGVFKIGFHQVTRSLLPILTTILILINLLINKRVKDRKNRIRLELTNIQDVMYFQNKIGTSQDVVLTYASKIAKPPLKESLEYLATAPKVKKSIEKALEDLRDISDVVELQSFSFILQQRQETGSVVENHKAQAQMMKRNKRLRRKINRQYKRTKLIISSFLLFACYALLLTIPLVMEMMRGLDLMFR
ncbi:MAG: hypothetical protein WC983_03405 [Tissierellaceae bacterium]